jgi:hypothetical protein
LRGFVWRDDERPKSIDDLFKDDPPLNLPTIKGLKSYIPQEEFFDENLMKRINASGESVKNKKGENKAARRVPKTRQGRENKQKLNEPLKKGQKLGDFLNKQKNN